MSRSNIVRAIDEMMQSTQYYEVQMYIHLSVLFIFRTGAKQMHGHCTLLRGFFFKEFTNAILNVSVYSWLYKSNVFSLFSS